MNKLDRLDKITEYINQLERVSTHDIAKNMILLSKRFVRI